MSSSEATKAQVGPHLQADGTEQSNCERGGTTPLIGNLVLDGCLDT